MRKLLVAIATLWLSIATAQAAPTIALQSGAPVNFSIAANSFTTSYYIDVAESDQYLRIDLDSVTAGVDVGFFLRHGSAFPDSFGSGRPINLDYIQELAHYQSIGSDNDEWVQIGKTGAEPLRAGRWYLFIVNLNLGQGTSIAANSTLLATITQTAPAAAAFSVNFNATGTTADPCSVTEWFDATAAAPIGGNPGTTIGELRRNAMLEAARLLSQQMRSPVPITIDACWSNLGVGNDLVTLARAGPRTVVSNIASMPRKHTWYVDSPTARMGGTSLCRVLGSNCGNAEIRATFNNQIDTPAALGATSYYYGYQAGGGSGIDFITVGMHEITHGLGFLSLVEIDATDSAPGSKFLDTDDIYSVQLAWLQNGVLRPFHLLSDAERMQAAVAGNNLKWMDASATLSPFNPRGTLAAPDNYVQAYAPNPIQLGSSVSHINQVGYTAQMMRPQIQGAQRDLSLARNMLDAVGWSNAATTAAIDPVPLGGFFYDPKHTGHGIEFSPVTADGSFYSLIFYTYDAAGNPEWFLSTGKLIDGRFMPEPDINGNSLQRFTYDPTRPSGSRQQLDASYRGRVRLDFVQAANATVCSGARATTGYLAVMSFALGDNQTQEWCMQELLPRALRPSVDVTGTWYAGPTAQDSGWGFSLGSLPGTGNGGLFGVLYYYDAQGKPRWAHSSLDNLAIGSSADLLNRNGYCRTCAVPAGFPAGRDTDIGNITYSLQAAGAAGSQVTFSATWPGAEGGTFARTASPLSILTVPVSAQNPQ